MIKKLSQLIRTYKPQAIVVVCVLLLVSFIPSVHAGWFVEDLMSGVSSLVGRAIGEIMQLIMMLLGLLLSMMINVVIWVAQYTKFSDAKAVTAGWVIVRDLANMALVISLLYNAFKAVFNTESDYNITSHLGKIVVAAILVNFSKMITLVLVDISQVIMMSFVNAFADIGPGNLYKILNIESYLRITSASAGGLGAAAGGMIAATFLMVVSLGVLIGMAAVLVVRIVVIWFMIVISPIAMVASATKISQLGGIAKKYWTTLSQWLTLGPMMAFVIWLTFTSMSTFGKEDNVVPPGASFSQGVAGLGNAFGAEAFMGYVFSIAMMVYGIKFAIEASGAAGGVFSKAYGLASKRLGIPEASVSGATQFFRNRVGNATDLTLAAGRRFSKDAVKYKDDTTLRGALARGGGKLGQGIGTVAVGVKGVGNTLKYGSLSGVVGAGYRQLVKDEKGAVGDELHHMNEHEVEGHEKRFEALGDNALLGELAHIKNGTRPGMTGMEAIAIMRLAQKKGKLKDIDEVNDLQEKIMKMSGDAHFKEDEIGKLREKVLPEGSIQKLNEFTLDKDGKQVPNLGKTLSKISDQASELTALNIGKSVNFKTDHKKDWRTEVKNEDGSVTKYTDINNQAFQRSKAQLLGLNSQVVGQTNESFKENLRDHLNSMLENSVDANGNSILSEVEIDKIEELLGATYADGQRVKNAKTDEALQAELNEGKKRAKSIDTKLDSTLTNRKSSIDSNLKKTFDEFKQMSVGPMFKKDADGNDVEMSESEREKAIADKLKADTDTAVVNSTHANLLNQATSKKRKAENKESLKKASALQSSKDAREAEKKLQAKENELLKFIEDQLSAGNSVDQIADTASDLGFFASDEKGKIKGQPSKIISEKIRTIQRRQQEANRANQEAIKSGARQAAQAAASANTENSLNDSFMNGIDALLQDQGTSPQPISSDQITEQLERMASQYEQGIRNFKNENISTSAQERLNVVRDAIKTIETNSAQLTSDQIQKIIRDTSESLRNSANNPKPKDSDVVV